MSSINTNNIDKNFPEPGKDNDSIGFRNNFSEIADNLDTAKTEISDLQRNVARTDGTVDFNGNTLSDLGLRNYSENVYDIGNVSTNQTIDFSNGGYQTLVIDADISITLTGWPEVDRHASLKLHISKNSESNHTVTFDTVDSQTIKVDATWPESFLITENEQPFIVEFTTADSGATLYGTYLGNYTTGFDSTISINPFTVRDLSIKNNAVIDGDLTVNGVINFPDLELPADLDSLNDVDLSSVLINDQILRYNATSLQWENVDDPLSNVEVNNVSDQQILRYNSTTENWENVDDPLFNVDIDSSIGDKQVLTYNALDNVWQNADNPLSNIDLSSVEDNHILRYNNQTETWETIDNPLAVTNITNLNDGDILRYNSLEERWVNSELLFQNIEINSITDKQVLRYNLDEEKWENVDFGTIEEISVTIADNGGQQEFRFDGQFLQPGDFFWQVGTIYKFDISDQTNSFGPLRFSTTPDTAVPGNITPYTENVQIVGEAGETGAYVQIKITDNTPTPLYLYGEKTDPQVDVSLLGKGENGAIDVGIKKKIGSFDSLKANVVGKDSSTLVDYENSEVVGLQKPEKLVIPVVTTAERDAMVPPGGVPFIGELVFNTEVGSTGTLQIYTGGGEGWKDLSYAV